MRKVQEHFKHVMQREKQKKSDATYVRLGHELSEKVERLCGHWEIDKSKVIRELASCAASLYLDGGESIGVTPKAIEAFKKFLVEQKLQNVDVAKMMILLAERNSMSSQLDAKKGNVG